MELSNKRDPKPLTLRFCLLKDRVEQGQFRVCWDAGQDNVADHPTKHHAGEHRGKWRPAMMHVEGASPATVQGCVETMTAPSEPWAHLAC